MSNNDIKITINGRQVSCGRDETILDAAKKAGLGSLLSAMMNGLSRMAGAVCV